MRTTLSISLVPLLLTMTAAAPQVTISGYVIDANSGERMIGATVYEEESFAGTVTYSYGFFSLTPATGRNRIVLSYLGYAPPSPPK